MNLHSSNPFFILNTAATDIYPSLDKNINTDVLIIGGGISSAIIAWELHHADIDVCIVDKKHLGLGSTAASTGLLQYEIDVPLFELIKKVGNKKACLSYLLCLESIHQLKEISDSLKKDNGFKLVPSFQFASNKKDVPKQMKESYLRNCIGIRNDFLQEDEIYEKFGFRKASGILSEDGAYIDAYKFTKNLFSRLHEKGVSIYNNTEATDITYKKSGVATTTSNGYKINSKYTVIACGYESSSFLRKRRERLHSTYAFISEPLSDKLWYKNALIWETKNPYLYIREYDKNRVIVGGADDDFYNTDKRDKNLSKKSMQILRQFQKLFPHIDIKVDHQWAGTFASTPDGLPYISTAPFSKKVWFALGFGGNGITFSMIAANIIRDAIKKNNNHYLDLYSLNR